MEILYLSCDLVAAKKPPMMPSQPDPSGDLDLMSALGDALRSRGERDELFLIHRLDRTVGGVLVFARNKAAAARMSCALAEGKLQKEYLAVIDGRVPEKGTLEDYLIKDAKTSRAHAVPSSRKGAKLARLYYEALAYQTDGEREVSLVKIQLQTGRFHQIRIQFSSRHTPVLGDGKYGSRTNKCKIALFSHHLGFPDTGKVCEARALPDLDRYPWNLFDKEIFQNV